MWNPRREAAKFVGEESLGPKKVASAWGMRPIEKTNKSHSFTDFSIVKVFTLKELKEVS